MHPGPRRRLPSRSTAPALPTSLAAVPQPPKRHELNEALEHYILPSLDQTRRYEHGCQRTGLQARPGSRLHRRGAGPAAGLAEENSWSPSVGSESMSFDAEDLQNGVAACGEEQLCPAGHKCSYVLRPVMFCERVPGAVFPAQRVLGW